MMDRQTGDQSQLQSDVFAFLADPTTHELREPVIRIDTHGAAVFLAGNNVYKVKRAVRFPFMDFSTLDKRRRACERELRRGDRDVRRALRSRLSSDGSVDTRIEAPREPAAQQVFMDLR
jgi:hypothetical protein